jgi:hypothetical protein
MPTPNTGFRKSHTMPMESPVPAKPPNKGFRELRTLKWYRFNVCSLQY